MGESGKVIAENPADNKITVSIRRKGACEKCGICVPGEIDMLMEAENNCMAKVGDFVEVALEEGYFFRTAAITYGLPLLAFVAGIILGTYLFDDVAALFIGICLTLLMYLLIRLNRNKLQKKNYLPKAVSVIENEHHEQ